jgi:hypothetical protein
MTDTIHPLILLREKFPDETFVTITGYLGSPQSKETIRLYPDLSAKVGYDIPLEAVAYREEVKDCDCKEHDKSDVQAIKLYLKASAQISVSFRKSAKDLFAPPKKAPTNFPFPPFPSTIPNKPIPPIVKLSPIEQCQQQLCSDIKNGMNEYSAVEKFKMCLNNLGITNRFRIDNLLLEASIDCGIFYPENDPEDPDNICGVPGFPPCSSGFP